MNAVGRWCALAASLGAPDEWRERLVSELDAELR